MLIEIMASPFAASVDATVNGVPRLLFVDPCSYMTTGQPSGGFGPDGIVRTKYTSMFGSCGTATPEKLGIVGMVPSGSWYLSLLYLPKAIWPMAFGTNRSAVSASLIGVGA